MSFVDDTKNIEDAIDGAPEPCSRCDEIDCNCCQNCDGEGYISDSGCGGGCEFCRPFPRCANCRGTGKERS